MITKKEGINERELDDEMILHDPVTDKIHVLNDTARVVWQMADGTHSPDDIVKELINRFSTDDNTNIKGDIDKTISELRDKGLLKG